MDASRLQTISLKIIDWSLIAILFFVPLYFAWFHENYTVFDLNKSVALRFGLLIAAAAFLIFTSTSGRLFYIKSKKILFFWLATFGLMALSTFLSVHPLISLLGSYERQQGFNNLAAYLLFFAFLVIFTREQRQFRRLFVSLQISAALICAYGLLQVLGFDFLRWSESSALRIFSTFGQPNFFGHFLAVIIPLTLYSLFFIGKKIITRLLFALLLAMEIICLIFTYSRSAWLAFLVSVIVASLIALWHWRKKYLTISLSVAVVLCFVAITLSPVRSFIIKQTQGSGLSIIGRAVSALDTSAGSATVRFRYWGAGLQAFGEAPLKRQLFGFGPDVQADVFVRQYQSDWGYYEKLNSFPDRAHNAPLDFLLQFGLLGLASLTGLIIFSIWPLFQKLRHSAGRDFWLCLALGASLIAYGINNLFSFSLTAMATLFYWLLASAYLFGSNFPPAKEQRLTFFQPVSRWLISGSLLILLLVIFFTYNVKPMVADYYYIQVKKAEAFSDCRLVLDNMEKVMAWYPVSHYYARAYLHHSVNCFGAVTSPDSRQQLINNIIEQTANLPAGENQFYTLIDLAHAYSILGYYADPKYYVMAENYYLELLAINPAITITYQDYGRMKLWQAKFNEARQIFNNGLAAAPALAKADPTSGHTKAITWQVSYFYNLIGLAYKSEGDFQKAEAEYKLAIAIEPNLTSPYKELADIAYQRGDLDAAIKYNQTGFTIEPRVALWPVNLAILYFEKKDFAKARYYAEAAQALDAQDSKIKELLDRLNNKQ